MLLGVCPHKIGASRAVKLEHFHPSIMLQNGQHQACSSYPGRSCSQHSSKQHSVALRCIRPKQTLWFSAHVMVFDTILMSCIVDADCCQCLAGHAGSRASCPASSFGKVLILCSMMNVLLTFQGALSALCRLLSGSVSRGRFFERGILNDQSQAASQDNLTNFGR